MKPHSMVITVMLLVLLPIICISEPAANLADSISIGAAAVCNDSRVRVRSAPNLQGETLGHLNIDDRVEVLDKSAKKMLIGDMVSYWYKIRRLRDNLTGWAYGYFLEPAEAGERLATIDSLYPYLIDGVDFYISDDGVPMYAEPRKDAQVLFTMRSGEAVTPIRVSDHPDPTLPFGMQQFWYLCVVNAEPDVVGWIRRPGLTCKVDIEEDEIYVVNMYEFLDKRIGIAFRQSFIDGTFQRVRHQKKMLEPGAVYQVFDTDGQSLIGKIEITDTDPRVDTAAWIEGGEITRSFALLDPKGRITLGWSEFIPHIELVHKPPIETLHEYLCSELAAVTGKETIELNEIGGILQVAHPVPIMDHGVEFEGDVTYHVMIGHYEGWSAGIECFLIRHPNGDVVRTNLGFHVREIDEEEEARWEDTIAEFRNGSLSIQVNVTHTQHFTPFPATFITLNHEIYEGSMSYLSVTNGYIVFNIGEWYYHGP